MPELWEAGAPANSASALSNWGLLSSSSHSPACPRAELPDSKRKKEDTHLISVSDKLDEILFNIKSQAIYGTYLHLEINLALI